MKNLKYLQIFEAFESKTLSKVFNYVNKAQKGQFKTILENLCDKLNFPMSALSDDLFQYLSFNKALQLTYNVEDKPCDNESDTIPGEKCSGPTGDENQGTIMRTWGRGRRRVECIVCKGTGIKPKTNFPIKWIKFWFDKDGKYIQATITDGQIRQQSGSDYKGGTLDDRIDQYEVEKTGISWNELTNYSTGDIFKFSDSSGNGTGVAMLFIDNGKAYMIQNFASGSTPDYSDDWMKAARFSWVVNSSSDVRGTLTLLKPKNVDKDENVEEKPDPYSWNALVRLGNLSVQRSSKVKEEIQGAHFALVLDYVKMKEKTKESTFKDTQVTKQKREESKIDAAALKLPNNIRTENYERYTKTISKNIKITSDITSIKNLFMRVLGMQYAGHYVLQGLHFGDLESIFEKIIKFLQNLDQANQDSESDAARVQQVYVDGISSYVKNAMENTTRYNSNIRKNLDYLYTASPSPEHTKILDKFVQVNKAIVDKIRSAELDSIEDAVVFYGKVRRMREDYKNSPLFSKALKVSDINYYLEGSDEDRCLRYLTQVPNSDISGILANFDQYIKYINKL